MKCAICKSKTTWGESHGYNEFIVCPKCLDRLEPHKTALGFYSYRNYEQAFLFELR